MEPTTPYSHEDDVDSTHSSNSTASDGTEREENNNNESQEETRTSRSPNEALDEIRRQQTHNLYCPKCKTNITKSAELVVKNQETDSYKTKAYVLWVPLVISPFEFPTLHLLLSFLTGLWKKLKTLVPNCLSRLSPNFLPLRYLLVAVLLLLSVIVLWSSDPPLPPPPPPYPSPLPPPPSPSPTPGPDSPLPSPGPDSPLPLPGPPPSPSPTPGPDSPLPSPGPPPSPSPTPGPDSPLPSPGPDSPLPLPGPPPSPSPTPGPDSPLPSPGPDSPLPSPGPDPPLPSPGPHLYEKNRWLIHFPSIKYLSVFSLLFLAILTLPWASISPIFNNLIAAIKTWSKRVIPQTFIKPQPRLSSTDKALDDKNTSRSEETITPNTQLDNKVPLPDVLWKSNVDPTREPDVSDKPIDDPSPVLLTEDHDKPISIPISVPNPKEMWKYIVVLVQNHLPMLKYIVVLVQNHLPRELDILKSIVYGGLIESITSLGVVSSAVASGASTLNVISLGLASLSSGLIIICNNLFRLKTNQPRSQSTNTDHMTSEEVDDPYQTLLGNKRNFTLHCVVVVLSFFFFGVIPPLCYAFSYRITDKGHYKAAVVLAASLVCVISLSFAKAYAFRMQKLRTMAEYTGMAFGASAFSFIASRIVSDIFEKFGFHELAAEYRKD